MKQIKSFDSMTLSGLEFAYTQSPAHMRGVVMGVTLAMSGFGFYVAAALASIVKHASHGTWYPDDLNHGSLEYYMFLLAGLMLVNTAVFVWLAVKYRYTDHEHQMSENHLEGCSQSGGNAGENCGSNSDDDN